MFISLFFYVVALTNIVAQMVRVERHSGPVSCESSLVRAPVLPRLFNRTVYLTVNCIDLLLVFCIHCYTSSAQGVGPWRRAECGRKKACHFLPPHKNSSESDTSPASSAEFRTRHASKHLATELTKSPCKPN